MISGNNSGSRCLVIALVVVVIAIVGLIAFRVWAVHTLGTLTRKVRFVAQVESEIRAFHDRHGVPPQRLSDIYGNTPPLDLDFREYGYQTLNIRGSTYAFLIEVGRNRRLDVSHKDMEKAIASGSKEVSVGDDLVHVIELSSPH